MRNLQKLTSAALFIVGLTLTGCLHVVEEVTFRKNGSGNYKMTLDMSEVKGMMDMFKGMGGDSTTVNDSTAIVEGGGEDAAGMGDNPMSQLGQEMSGVATSLKNLPGITNVVEIKDTAAFQFGYSFDFVDIAALNRALKVINKEKYESKAEEVFVYSGKNFERLSAGDIGEELKKAMSESGGEDEEGSLEMVKMFFAEMSYKQVYHFPDQTIKKNSNELGEISSDGKTLTIMVKPFSEEQAKKKVGIGTKVKLK